MRIGLFEKWDNVVGSVELTDNLYHGKLLSICDREISALITYEAEDLLELHKAFKEAVKEYYKIKGEKQKMGSSTEDKETEYTTKKGNVLTFSYKAECFSGSGAEGAWGRLYDGMNINNSGTFYYEKIVEDEEIAKVLSVARDEGDEALEDYIKSQKPKKYKVSIIRDYECRYTAEFEVEAESEEDALDKAENLTNKDFKTVSEVFNDIALVDEEILLN